MTLALDKRQGHFVVVDADNPEKVKSIKYKKELNALRWIKLATGFPRDVSFMNVRRLYEEREVEVEPEVITEVIPVEEDEVPETEWIALYFCTKCNRNHEKTSNIGREHLKYREVN